MDIVTIAQGLIDKLVAEAQQHEALAARAMHRAEGVKLLYETMLQEHNKLIQAQQQASSFSEPAKIVLPDV